MTSERQSLIIGFAISIIAGIVLDQGIAVARGGGAGFGRGNFGRAGFDRGDFNRGDFDRGFDRYGSDVGDIHGFSGYPHPAAAENRTYNWGDRGLATDAGLNRATAANAVRADAVRDAYRYPGVFDSGWWGAHPNAWGYAGWGNGWAWGGADWPLIAGWWGMPVETAPVPYDYGNNITYQNDNVYYGTQPVETTAAYFQQAQNLAQSVPVLPEKKNESLDKDWKPLGVYSLVQGGQSNTNMMFQIAVNKKGAIKGNYYNALTDETKPISGAVDKKSMRAAWIVGGNKNVVYDTGLDNLLKEQSSVLVHLGKDKTQQWTLVKLQQSKKEAS